MYPSNAEGGARSRCGVCWKQQDAADELLMQRSAQRQAEGGAGHKDDNYGKLLRSQKEKKTKQLPVDEKHDNALKRSLLPLPPFPLSMAPRLAWLAYIGGIREGGFNEPSGWRRSKPVDHERLASSGQWPTPLFVARTRNQYRPESWQNNERGICLRMPSIIKAMV